MKSYNQLCIYVYIHIQVCAGGLYVDAVMCRCLQVTSGMCTCRFACVQVFTGIFSCVQVCKVYSSLVYRYEHVYSLMYRYVPVYSGSAGVLKCVFRSTQVCTSILDIQDVFMYIQV